MLEPTQLQRTIQQFLNDREARGLAKGTLIFYRAKLKYLSDFCNQIDRTEVIQVTPDNLRAFILTLAAHTPGGIHAIYRAARAFFLWYEEEYEPTNWINPARKVKAPRTTIELLEPIPVADVKALLKTCHPLVGFNIRDRAILLILYDTGLRASELCALNIEDIDLTTSTLTIKQGKGSKPRSAFLGQQARRATRIYLAYRRTGPAFIIRGGGRLTYNALRDIVIRRAKKAKVVSPALHSFRRAFALNCLRAGMDVFSLQRLMGHKTLTVLRRYLAQTDDDLRTAHAAASPVDRLG